MSVKTITALTANKLGKFLAKDFRRIFGPAHDDVAERLASLARVPSNAWAEATRFNTISSTPCKSRWSDVIFYKA